MITKAEFVYHIIHQEEVKLKKKVSDLDAYYNKKAAWALANLGMVHDPYLLDSIRTTPCNLIETKYGQTLSCNEMLILLPEGHDLIVPEPEPVPLPPASDKKANCDKIIIDDIILKTALGDRAHYRLQDALENLTDMQKELILEYLKQQLNFA